MPEMDGFEMSLKIKELTKGYSVDIYAVTAMNEFQITDRCQKYGIIEVLSKPVTT